MPRRALVVAIASALLLPAALYVAARIFLRHVPYAIPASLRAPEALRAGAEGGLSLRWLGVSGYVLDDGTTTLVLDPAVTRPRLQALLSGPVVPDDGLASRWVPEADYILVNHAHYDHAVDAPSIALRTGAVVVGTRSACNLARSRGVPERQIREVRPGERLLLGTFTIDVRAHHHSPIWLWRDPMSGVVPEDAGPLWFWEYEQDGTLLFRIEGAGASLLFSPAAGLEEADASLAPAATLVVGVSGHELSAERVRAMVERTRPRLVLPTHYDNFFHPLEDGLALLPFVDLPAVREAFRAVDAELAFVVLDFDEEITLPPDPAGEGAGVSGSARGARPPR